MSQSNNKPGKVSVRVNVAVDKDTMLKAARIVEAVAYAFREGQYGEEQTSRDIRDAVLTAASTLRDAAEHPEKSLKDLIEGEDD